MLERPQLNPPPQTILVVDDDHGVRESTREAMELEGYRVIEAADGREALKQAKSSPRPHLILLDMNMPIMGGREFLDTLLTEAEIASIPVLIISATVNSKNSVGAVDFLRKPVELDELLQKVAHHVR